VCNMKLKEKQQPKEENDCKMARVLQFTHFMRKAEPFFFGFFQQ